MTLKIFISLSILGIIASTLFLALTTKPKHTIQTMDRPQATHPEGSTQLAAIESIITQAETDPARAIEALKLFVAKEPEYMNQCHELAHEIGHIAYEHFGEDAFTYKDPFCGGGYLHGLLEEATIFDDTMSLKEMVHTVCSGDIEESCLHGLGHVIYKSVQEVSSAVDLCDKVRTKNKDCYDGIYMELFDTEQELATIPASEAMRLCTAASTATRPSCIFYLPRTLKQSTPETVAMFCATLPQQTDRLTCAQGSGVMFMKYAPIFELDIVTKDCAAYTNDDLKGACVTGVENYFTYGNVTNTEW